MLEKNLQVTKLDGMPAALKKNERGPRGKPRSDFKPRQNRGPDRGQERDGEKKYAGKSESRFQRKQRRSSERDFGAPHSTNEDFKKTMPNRELAGEERKASTPPKDGPKKPKKPKKPKPKKPKKPKRPKLGLKNSDAGLAPRKRKAD